MEKIIGDPSENAIGSKWYVVMKRLGTPGFYLSFYSFSSCLRVLKWFNAMGGSPGDVSQESDVVKATEGLGKEL